MKTNSQVIFQPLFPAFKVPKRVPGTPRRSGRTPDGAKIPKTSVEPVVKKPKKRK